MSAPAWTKGPWSVRSGRHRSWIAKVGNNPSDPQIWSQYENTGHYEFGDKLADAHLIAAAPELHDALDHLLRVIATDQLIPETALCMERARFALAKARGEGQ